MTSRLTTVSRTVRRLRPSGRAGRVSALVLCLVCCACGGERVVPGPDPSAGRQALERMLAAWKGGESSGSLEAGSPSIVVADYRWRDGYRLERYEIEPDGGPRGPNLKLRVKCWLRDPRGKAVKETAAYAVGTGSPLTIIRDNEL